MAIDTLIKKFFPGIIGLVLALVAYLQASGVVQLATAEVLAVDPKALGGATPRAIQAAAESFSPKNRSVQSIIDNNVFDHSTDLNPPPPPTEEEKVEQGPPKIDLSDPLGAGRCEGVQVTIVTESPNADASLAVLKAPGDERPTLRHVGDVAGGFDVVYIGYNRVEASPAVWMIKDYKLCQSLLFPETNPPPAASAAAPPPPPVESAHPDKGAPGAVPPEIASKIQKVSENEYNVDRAVVDMILERQADLMRSARMVPEKGADGKTVGIRLFGVRPDTLLGTLGLQNGDRLETINNFNISNPEEALNAYARLRTANKLTINVTRRGQPSAVDINIK